MNICYIAKTAVPSSTAESIYVMQMCQAYASLGHQVTLMVPNQPAKVDLGGKDVFTFYGLRHRFAIRKIPLRQWCPDTLGHGMLLPLTISSTRPDVVHSRSLAPAWGLANLFRLPTIFEIHNAPSPNAWPKRLFDRLMTSQYLQALVVLTQALADHVKPMLPKRTRVLVAPDGVDAEWLARPNSPEAARAELGLSLEKRRIVVYTGHLYRGRGIELIIELAQKMSDHLFLIVGGRETDIAHYRQQTGRLENFCLAGFKPPAQIITYLQAADALLMPYADKVEVAGGGDTSSFCSPMKMFEYMAAGRPILSSSLPVLREVLQDGINGILLPYNEPQRWMEALQRLQQDNKLAEALGHQARLDVQQYTWDKRVQKILEQSGVEALTQR
ncbi:MAG: glycosyltransferase family 4 protein [Bdellovibrio sp.]|nr:glycosyltransferase family 4 protein [Bdellovibrio sp.]